MERCGKLAKLYGAYLFGDTTEEETARISRHLEECPACRADMEARQGVINAIPKTYPKLSAEDRQRIAWSVKASLRQPESRRSFWQMMPLAHSLSLVMLLASVTGVAFYGARSRQVQDETYMPPRDEVPGIERPLQTEPEPRLPVPDYNTDTHASPVPAPPQASGDYVPRSSPWSATSRFHPGSRFYDLGESWRQVDWYGRNSETTEEPKDKEEGIEMGPVIEMPTLIPNMEQVPAVSEPPSDTVPDIPPAPLDPPAGRVVK